MEKFKTKQGVEHGMIEQIANSVTDHGYKNLSEKNRKEMLERRKRDLEPVKVRYQNLKDQENGKWEGWYGDHPGEPLKAFRFIHGQRYTVPRGLARKVNAMGAPIRSGLLDARGNELEKDGEMIRTHQLVPDQEF